MIPILRVRDARENNLQGVDLDLPLGAIVAFTGPSGSGKSSLAVDTLLIEGQRRLLEVFGARAGQPLPARPAVGVITGLPPTVGMLQRYRPAPRSTVGTLTDLSPLLRALAAHRGVVRCPRCGRDLPARTSAEIAASLLAHPTGTRLTILAPVRRGQPGEIPPLLEEINRQGFARVRLDGEMHHLDEVPAVDPAQPHDLEVVIDRLKIEPDRQDRLLEGVQTALAAGAGRMLAEVGDIMLPFADHPYCFADDLAFAQPTPQHLSPSTPAGACPQCQGLGCEACGGSGLGELGRQVYLGESSFPQVLAATIGGALGLLRVVPPAPATAALQEEIERRLLWLVELDLEHLSVGQKAASLASGELVRARLAGCLGHSLSGALFVLDEPTAGLHPDDIPYVLGALRRLREDGNSVIVIDHAPQILEIADHQVLFGPGAGAAGGQIVHAGPPQPAAPTPWPAIRPAPVKGPLLRLEGATGATLQDLDVSFPLGKWTVVCGRSGSGKSTLVSRTLAPGVRQHLGQEAHPLPFRRLAGLEPIKRLIELDRQPLARSERSCVATLAGVWTPIRELLAASRAAKVRGFGPERFSFNRPGGRCEACHGLGQQALELAWLPPTSLPCPVCGGKRFDPATLSVTYRGASVDQILRMTAGEARQLFASHPRLLPALSALCDVGLAYLPLGEPSEALSGGEAQRVRLAIELARAGTGADLADTLVILDEPAAALHPADVAPIAEALRRIVTRGATLVAVAYQPALVAAADRVVQLGDGGGHKGGKIVLEGVPS